MEALCVVLRGAITLRRGHPQASKRCLRFVSEAEASLGGVAQEGDVKMFSKRKSTAQREDNFVFEESAY